MPRLKRIWNEKRALNEHPQIQNFAEHTSAGIIPDRYYSAIARSQAGGKTAAFAAIGFTITRLVVHRRRV